MTEKNKRLVKAGYYLATIKKVNHEVIKWWDGSNVATIVFVLSFFYRNIEINIEYGIYEDSCDETVKAIFEALPLHLTESEMIHFNYDSLIGAKVMCYIDALKSDDGDYCYNTIGRIVPYVEIPDDYWDYFR